MPAFIDLTGQRFGQLTVLSREPSGKQGAAWLCKCDCGCGKKTVCGKSLRSGGTKGCGCLHFRFKDITGQRFGRLTVLSRATNKSNGRHGSVVAWLCRCDCGKETVVIGSSLKGGKTNSKPKKKK